MSAKLCCLVNTFAKCSSCGRTWCETHWKPFYRESKKSGQFKYEGTQLIKICECGKRTTLKKVKRTKTYEY